MDEFHITHIKKSIWPRIKNQFILPHMKIEIDAAIEMKWKVL